MRVDDKNYQEPVQQKMRHPLLIQGCHGAMCAGINFWTVDCQVCLLVVFFEVSEVGTFWYMA